MSFWYHCKEHIFSFNLIPKSSSYSYFLRYDYLCIKPRAVSLEVWFWEISLKVSYSHSFGFDRLQKMLNFFVGKCLKINQKLHGSDRKHIKLLKKKKKRKKRKKKNLIIIRWVILHPHYQLQLSISQNRPVQLVPYFVGVHHNFEMGTRQVKALGSGVPWINLFKVVR